MEGFTYLAVVIDLYSRRVVGWPMQSRQTTDVVLQALHMAGWWRKPKLIIARAGPKRGQQAAMGEQLSAAADVDMPLHLGIEARSTAAEIGGRQGKAAGKMLPIRPT